MKWKIGHPKYDEPCCWTRTRSRERVRRTPRWLVWLSAKVKGKNDRQHNFPSWAGRPFVGLNEPPKSQDEKSQTKANERPKTRNKSVKRHLSFSGGTGPVSKKVKIPTQEATAGPSGPTGPSTQVPAPTDLVQI